MAPLSKLAKTIHIVLAPVSALVWGYDKIKDFVSTTVAGKLKDVPPENIVSPKPNVAGPALEALKYTGHEETLREMYANLLAASMDSRTANGAHPAFVEIIRQLTPDEARIIRLFSKSARPVITIRAVWKKQTPEHTGGHDVLVNFSLLGWEAGCEFPDLTPTYLNNLCRLGLTEIPSLYSYTEAGVYDALEDHPTVQKTKAEIEESEEFIPKITREVLDVTPMGHQFYNTCVISHENKGLPKRPSPAPQE